MNTHDKYELPPLPYPQIPGNDYTAGDMREYATAAIEPYAKRRQSEAEEVCAEAYQVVGSLLSDLGIFETEHAEKILDNLSQARMVHKDVLPWHSHDRKRRDEPVAWPKTAAEIRDFIGVHYISMTGDDGPSDDDKYTLTAHDLLSAFRWWTGFAPQPAEQVIPSEITDDKLPSEDGGET